MVWGAGIGTGLGVVHYILTELLPYRWPLSIFGQARAAILTNPVVQWVQIRDGWAVWADAGREVEWKGWKEKYDERQASFHQKRVD